MDAWNPETTADPGGIRINRYLASCGICSRRDADRLVSEGRVTIDGATAPAGARVPAGADVRLEGRPVKPRREHAVIAYYKPRGVVCTDRDAHAARTLAQELSGRPELAGLPRLLYIGRLDAASEGLLLLTEDSGLKRALERPDSRKEKEYHVTTDRPLSQEAAKRLARGVYLEELGLVTRPCEIRQLGSGSTFSITLTEGKNRQIRRMCATEGLQVLRLVRVREAGISLGTMEPGALRRLAPAETEALYHAAQS